MPHSKFTNREYRVAIAGIAIHGSMAAASLTFCAIGITWTRASYGGGFRLEKQGIDEVVFLHLNIS